MKFIGAGKVKDIYDLEDGTLSFKFSDRVSAYDVKFKEEIPQKGEVLCKFAQFWFNELPFPNHFVKRKSDNELVVKKMKMLPIECVVRGYFYGSLASRWKKGEITVPEDTDTTLAAKLPKPVFDPTTKAEQDIPVNRKKAIQMNLVTPEQFDFLSETSTSIYKQMVERADSAGFILADLKLEFGVLDGKITLGDSIGPDEYRLWPKSEYAVGKIQEAYDKQLLRDWLTKEGYQQQFEEDRKSGKTPKAPPIPDDLIKKISERYITAYEKITRESL
ncbi:MAG: phosphoribosylaminoimidazolesuccinocarboxamide synthase [Nitrosopumilaceae archaeon]|nr:phosphoribosylaminoimidazolesuccinocarboxamide synthase [Nitrosopumilaceae archaeon]NIU02507.1 phosphoribosylaminoimidazolesuccinocarboxamide synthase [Nitrosopumilaceae archaeon]NIU88968.1 phosphoribosylaminoimidazolesuccinocarboxamide synthase [Nitrosopumilaceae archaeon]NIV67079.1 phosphoribosylaminoimidazolesuccinocarboxamide synthase [Nitrosopumilaceae archaeon]NIX63108.1 phosphoribosylaminoimidazolesuccinocarboxamide synthase [Nitrosopumilaceae archaeon]